MEGLKNELNEMLKGAVLPEMSGVSEQYIYKVPPIIRQTNPQAYTPQIISIGPFHNLLSSSSDNNILHQMEELKLKYLKGFLNRTNLCVDDFVLKLDQEWESRIRSCYAGHVSFDSNEFLKIIIIDACFIIELFLRCYLRYEGGYDWSKDDPILSKSWLFGSIRPDLVLIENQLPFFVLEDIYKLALNPDHVFPPFIKITLKYFDGLDFIISKRVQYPKHFTDLLRKFFLSSSSSSDFVQEGDYVEYLYSASQLSEAGLVFEVSESPCLLDLEFDKGLGVLKMPCFRVYDETEILMRNILAFEECHISDPNKYITQYLTILDFLINTEKDVSILVEKGVIVNRMGDDNAMATMVNNLCKNVSAPRFNSKYRTLCHGLNHFYDNPWNKYKAIFVREYFNTPWKKASTITAVLLLLLTFIQTVCSIWSLFLEK